MSYALPTKTYTSSSSSSSSSKSNNNNREPRSKYMERCNKLTLEAKYLRNELEKRRNELNMKQREAENQLKLSQQRKSRIQQIVKQSYEESPVSPVSPLPPPSPPSPPSTSPPRSPPNEREEKKTESASFERSDERNPGVERKRSSTLSVSSDSGGGGGGREVKTAGTGMETLSGRRSSTVTSEGVSGDDLLTTRTATSTTTTSSSSSSNPQKKGKVRIEDVTESYVTTNKYCYPDEDADFPPDDSSFRMPMPPELTGDSEEDEEIMKKYSNLCQRIRDKRKKEIMQKRQSQLVTIKSQISTMINESENIPDFKSIRPYIKLESWLEFTEIKKQLRELQGYVDSLVQIPAPSVSLIADAKSKTDALQQRFQRTFDLIIRERKQMESNNKTRKENVFAAEETAEIRVMNTRNAQILAMESAASGKIILWFRVRMLKEQPYLHPAEIRDWCTGVDTERNQRPKREMENKLNMYILDNRRNSDRKYNYKQEEYDDVQLGISLWGQIGRKKCGTSRSGVRIFIQPFERFNPQQSYGPGKIVQAFENSLQLYKFTCDYNPGAVLTSSQEYYYKLMVNGVDDPKRKLSPEEMVMCQFLTTTDSLYVNGFFGYKPYQIHAPNQKSVFRSAVYRLVKGKNESALLPNANGGHNEDWLKVFDNAQDYEVKNSVDMFDGDKQRERLQQDPTKGQQTALSTRPKKGQGNESLFCFNDKVQTQDDSVIRFDASVSKTEKDAKLVEYQKDFYVKVMEPHLNTLSELYKKNSKGAPNLAFMMYGPSGTGKSYTTEYLVQRAWARMFQDLKQQQKQQPNTDVLCIQSFDFDDQGVCDLFAPKPSLDSTGATVEGERLLFSPNSKGGEGDEKEETATTSQTPAFLKFTNLRRMLGNFRGKGFDNQLVTLTSEKIDQSLFESVMNWIKLSRKQLPTFRNPNGSSRSHLVYRLFYLPKSSVTEQQFISTSAIPPASSVYIIDLAGMEDVNAISSGGGIPYLRVFPEFVKEWGQERKKRMSVDSLRPKSPIKPRNTEVDTTKTTMIDFVRDITQELGDQSKFITESLLKINDIVQNTTKPYKEAEMTGSNRDVQMIFEVAMKNIMRRGTIVSIVACLSPSLSDYESTIETIKRMEDWQDIATKD